MIETYLNNMEYWHWWGIGFVFLILEILIPGFILIWFGTAAFIVGVFVMAMPLSIQAQLVIWSIFSIGSILAWRYWRKKYPPIEPTNTLNQRGYDFIGRRFTLEEDVINGFVKIKIDDSTWKVELEDDLKKGDKIVITGIDSTVLTAEKSGDTN